MLSSRIVLRVGAFSVGGAHLEFHRRTQTEDYRVLERFARHRPRRIRRAAAGVDDILEVGLERPAVP